MFTRYASNVLYIIYSTSTNDALDLGASLMYSKYITTPILWTEFLVASCELQVKKAKSISTGGL